MASRLSVTQIYIYLVLIFIGFCCANVISITTYDDTNANSEGSVSATTAGDNGAATERMPSSESEMVRQYNFIIIVTVCDKSCLGIEHEYFETKFQSFLFTLLRPFYNRKALFQII